MNMDIYQNLLEQYGPTLTPRDLSLILKISTKTIYKHLKDGKLNLPRVAIKNCLVQGEIIRFSTCDVATLISGETPAPPLPPRRGRGRPKNQTQAQ